MIFSEFGTQFLMILWVCEFEIYDILMILDFEDFDDFGFWIFYGNC